MNPINDLESGLDICILFFLSSVGQGEGGQFTLDSTVARIFMEKLLARKILYNAACICTKRRIILYKRIEPRIPRVILIFNKLSLVLHFQWVRGAPGTYFFQAGVRLHN